MIMRNVKVCLLQWTVDGPVSGSDPTPSAHPECCCQGRNKDQQSSAYNSLDLGRRKVSDLLTLNKPCRLLRLVGSGSSIVPRVKLNSKAAFSSILLKYGVNCQKNMEIMSWSVLWFTPLNRTKVFISLWQISAELCISAELYKSSCNKQFHNMHTHTHTHTAPAYTSGQDIFNTCLH